MPVSVTMPRLGESVTEGTVTRWLKHEGDRVEADEPLLEVSTDKVDTEIPSPAAGVLAKIVVGEDETAEVGSELAVIAGDGESADAPAQEQPAETAQAAPPQEAQAEPAQQAAETQPAETQPAETQPAETQPAETQPAASDSGSAGGGQTTVVRMPALGESVTEGTVTRWLKQVGETVEVDEPLLEVSTDKVDTEIPSPVAGTVVEIKVAEDETVPVGGELAVIGGTAGASQPEGEPAGEPEAAPAQAAAPEPAPAQPAPEPAPTQPAPEAQPVAAQSATAQPAPAQPAPAQPATAQWAPAQAGPAQTGAAEQAPIESANGEDFAGYITPLVRKLAAERNVNLADLNGTGVGGRIRKQDVLAAAEEQQAAQRRAAEQQQAAAAAAQQAAEQAPAPAAKPAAAPAAKTQPSPLRGRTEKLSRIRALTAKRMVEAMQTTAQLTTVVEVDVTKIARLREQAKAEFQARHGVKLSFLPFFTQATIEALQVNPVVNGSIDLEAGTVTYHDAEHLGIAVDTERGLIVPVIHNAGDLNLAGLAKRIADLAERARSNKLTPDEISGGTFTLTNTGSRGALFDTPIFTPPQVGILGTGAVVKRAVVVDDPDLGELILPRSMVYLALSYDHRLVDGADAARFLGTIKDRLEGGNFEADLGL
jgi:2-oxoglutarate dehydrogenase E2 component (dihydrolipoamide succinyltransferase)